MACSQKGFSREGTFGQVGRRKGWPQETAGHEAELKRRDCPQIRARLVHLWEQVGTHSYRIDSTGWINALFEAWGSCLLLVPIFSLKYRAKSLAGHDDGESDVRSWRKEALLSTFWIPWHMVDQHFIAVLSYYYYYYYYHHYYYHCIV